MPYALQEQEVSLPPLAGAARIRLERHCQSSQEVLFTRGKGPELLRNRSREASES